MSRSILISFKIEQSRLAFELSFVLFINEIVICMKAKRSEAFSSSDEKIQDGGGESILVRGKENSMLVRLQLHERCWVRNCRREKTTPRRYRCSHFLNFFTRCLVSAASNTLSSQPNRSREKESLRSANFKMAASDFLRSETAFVVVVVDGDGEGTLAKTWLQMRGQNQNVIRCWK